MKKIAFLAQKGGSGKTTLAVHTAVAATEAGESVVVIDTDPQKSATVWGDARSQEAPIVATAAASELGRVLEAADQERMTLAIVDTAPHAAPDATRIVRAVDLVAIPVRPTAFDIAAAGSAVDIVKAAGVRAVFVLSACPFRSPEIAETRTVLAEYGLPIAPVEIIDRRAFARAVATGRAVTEFESDGKAATEIRALWAWLKEQMQ
ncbi:MAG: ParA family partition ATPase [Acidovorax sp.]|uniref:Plasmid segregation oscillating ATPase ParF n=2 Tax=Neisseriales TaxID=206351 RepID=A0A0K6H9L2_9NEIS|nr:MULTISPECIES: ParA family partition ATPase [Neisseriales]ABV90267.1 putative MinD/ParA family ATPase [Laribacter hongkongensis]MDU7586136.1 ParA family partition ATPase [Acidovorax sp.]CUA87448.1 plasmid segregation oscillating ATPase ParF [Gulbenkiania indica]